MNTGHRTIRSRPKAESNNSHSLARVPFKNTESRRPKDADAHVPPTLMSDLRLLSVAALSMLPCVTVWSLQTDPQPKKKKHLNILESLSEAAEENAELTSSRLSSIKSC